jgi:hypothetical protein
MKLKFPAALATVAALAVGSVAFASGVSVKTTPTRPRPGQKVSMLVKGMKPGEKIKATEYAPFGQTQTSFPKFRVNAQGVILVTTTAHVHGKHTWVFTGRTSHRTGRTSYYVR